MYDASTFTRIQCDFRQLIIVVRQNHLGYTSHIFIQIGDFRYGLKPLRRGNKRDIVLVALQIGIYPIDDFVRNRTAIHVIIAVNDLRRKN